MSRKAGAAPLRTKTGRPDADRITSPSPKFVLGRGSDEISPTAPLTVEGAIEIGCGSPKRTVPRVTTSELSTRDFDRHEDRRCLGGRGARRHFCRRLNPGAHVPGAKRHASNRAQDSPENVYALCGHAVVPPAIDSVRAIFAGSVASAFVMRCAASERRLLIAADPGKYGVYILIGLLHFPGEQLLLDLLLDWRQYLLLHLEALGRDQALVILQFP